MKRSALMVTIVPLVAIAELVYEFARPPWSPMRLAGLPLLTPALTGSRSSCVYAGSRTFALAWNSFPTSRRNHEKKLLGSGRGQLFAVRKRRLSPGKEDQALRSAACCREDSSSAECGSHHSRILDGERKGPNPL